MKPLATLALLLASTCTIPAADDYLTIVNEKTSAFAAYAISTSETANRLNEAHPPLLLDVRERDEYAVSHLHGARFVSFRKFEIKQLADVPKDRPVILYCTIGYRSGKISKRLHEAGYKDVHNIRGGIIQWFNEGRVVEHDGKAANEIHPYEECWKQFVIGRRVTTSP